MMKDFFRKAVVLTVLAGCFMGSTPVLADNKCADPWMVLDPDCYKLK